MNRKEYKKIGIILVIVAILQYLILGCITCKLTGLTWLENVSFMLMCALLAGGIGMQITARNEKSYKKTMIEDKDERNQLIDLSACRVTLFVALISYAGVFIYLKNAGILSGLQIAIYCIPALVGAIVYGLATLYFKKRM